jgi:hypothetical protein
MTVWETRFRTWLADSIYPKGKRRRAAEEEEYRALQERTRRAYHKVWSNAVGTPDYKKSDWTELGALLISLGVTL